MSQQQLDSLKGHFEVAENSIRADDDAQLVELIANLRHYLSVVWQRKVDDEESEKAAIRLLAAANFVFECLVSQSLVEWLTSCIAPPARDFLKYVTAQREAKVHVTKDTALPSGHEFAIGNRRDEATIHLFEHFLQEIDPGQRRRAGVYYTPRPIVRFIVSNVQKLLQLEFGLEDGLADVSTWKHFSGEHDRKLSSSDSDRPFVNILDPAVGTGVFLVESIDMIHKTLVGQWRKQGMSDAKIKRRWNEYVPVHLLPRLNGVELMPAPCLLAAFNITLKLVETGYEFEKRSQLNLHVADSLSGPLAECDALYAQLPSGWQAAVRQAVGVCQNSGPTVVIGNPPYSALSNSESPWIEQLIRGRLPGGNATGSYYEVDGRPLNERKLWLHDDYVKFIRFGQWKIEEAGAGILGLVTNHGYLDNPTFRGMRQQLLKTFSSISLADLHGNVKKKETTIDGRPDKNVFDVEQGITIGLFRRTPGQSEATQVAYADVWGTREEKYEWLESRASSVLRTCEHDDGVAATEELHPVAPFYFFVPRDSSLDTEYESGFPLTELMPVNNSAVVTARDSFVIAMQRDELVHRISEFRDLTIPDAEIRRRYFGNTRSRKYPPGDTRGWKLSEARRRLAADGDWQNRIRKCLYRPFDERYIFWSDGMVDWPRNEVSRHLLDRENIVLIARRQMLPTQPCRYFWIADQLVLDGVIRSDNRGNETVFPLYLYDDERQANLDSDFVQSLAQSLSLTWIADGCGDLRSTFGPRDVVHYIYAMFYSSEYRERYANQLRVDFPRVFLPRRVEFFKSLCELGRQLISSQLLSQRAEQFTDEGMGKEPVVARGYPKYEGGCVYINDSNRFEDVASQVWNFHAGGHQVCRKWLKDRRGRSLTEDECSMYRRIVSAINTTIRLTESINALISAAGGWQNSFSLAARQ